jgi:hypothetical protein
MGVWRAGVVMLRFDWDERKNKVNPFCTITQGKAWSLV